MNNRYDTSIQNVFLLFFLFCLKLHFLWPQSLVLRYKQHRPCSPPYCPPAHPQRVRLHPSCSEQVEASSPVRPRLPLFGRLQIHQPHLLPSHSVALPSFSLYLKTILWLSYPSKSQIIFLPLWTLVKKHAGSPDSMDSGRRPRSSDVSSAKSTVLKLPIARKLSYCVILIG